MYGLKKENGEYVPDTDVSFVLDFDIGIWETDEEHYIGTTYTPPVLPAIAFFLVIASSEQCQIHDLQRRTFSFGTRDQA